MIYHIQSRTLDSICQMSTTLPCHTAALEAQIHTACVPTWRVNGFGVDFDLFPY